ncbi:MAG: tRNA preQ1(34) S-adenosylmethionine ribosyltransferase-isomerase QueA [Dysgonamonadaceae bacterium]|jgi:S-adenosylmethionine:tRNA ribosyltransferase-isomerase|nr:tRNA preQ1(34) S-adenosylmethionine ribosyltransferase-isomerase QueA [Dysgonamonadaceae bacterium]
MKLSQFKFSLPEEQIAQFPTESRDESRLMVVNRKTGKIEHRVFKEIIGYFNDKDVLIFNDTQIFPTRLHGSKEKTGAGIEVFLLRELNKENRLWDVLVDPARKIRIGNKLYFGEGDTIVAEVIDNTTSRGRTLRFLNEGSYEEFKKNLYTMGKPPVPSYIKRDLTQEDTERYQTIYARSEGGVVAPAAGFHFSPELFKRMEIKGCEFVYITAHTGLGYYRDIDVEDLTKYKMDSQEVIISEESAIQVNKAKDAGRQICAVGGTVMHATESAVTSRGYLTDFNGWTNRFIFPPYTFTLPTCHITNFHMPLSIIFIQTATYGGYELIMKCYKIALKEGYRFGAYGDAMLIL